MFRARNPAIRLLALLISVAVVSYGAWRSRAPEKSPAPGTIAAPLPPSPLPPSPHSTDAAILAAIERHRSHVWGQAAGTVARLLEDDRKGIPHQRFVLRLESGATLLIEYNLDLSPRITPLEVGDSVVVRGEYIWNDKGGVIHWVHRDPSGGPGGGWLRIRGKEYH